MECVEVTIALVHQGRIRMTHPTCNQGVRDACHEEVPGEGMAHAIGRDSAPPSSDHSLQDSLPDLLGVVAVDSNRTAMLLVPLPRLEHVPIVLAKLYQDGMGTGMNGNGPCIHIFGHPASSSTSVPSQS